MSQTPIRFPPAARRMDTLNDLLAASDVISLHCALTNETVQIINADCLQHIKPGTYILGVLIEKLIFYISILILVGCSMQGHFLLILVAASY